jgi:putative ABC transport system permease protein
VRLFTHKPGLAIAVVLTLAVGLGSVTAIVSIAHALLLRPLSFEHAERIVVIQSRVADANGRLSLREFRDLEREARLLARVGAYYRTQYNLTGDGPPQSLTCTMPSSGVFDVLGVRPVLGSVWPTSVDFTRHYTVLLSHGLWQRSFGAQRDMVGRTIVMDGASYTVSGILPDSVDFPLQTDVYRGVTDYNAVDVRRYSVIARIEDGRSLTDVQGELDILSQRFAETWPETNTGVRLIATPLRDVYVGGARPFVLLMVGAVALLITIAVMNVANLLLTRGLSREGEFAVRLALGASRWRLVQQGFVETAVLTVLGLALGAVGARWVVAAFVALVGSQLPPWISVRIDLTVVLASGVVAALVAFAIALIPAWHASKTDVERVLRQHAGRSGSRGRTSVRRWLVAAQSAVASLLLVTGGLFAGGLSDLLSVDPGFDRQGLLTFRTDPPFSRYGDIATTSEFYRRVTEALAEIPGVTRVGANTVLPFSRLDVPSPRVSVEGRDSGRADEAPFVNLQLIDSAYFDAMGIPVRKGRRFERTDDTSSPPVAIVSERTARRLWGDEDPVGRRLRLLWNQAGTGTAGGSEIWLTVVGVTAPVRSGSLEDVSGLDVYAPHTQMFAGDSFIVVRTGGDPGTLQRQIRAAIDRIDRDQSFFDMRTMEDRIGETLWQQRVAAMVLALFASVAFVLALLGTFAVTAHAVTTQRRELGVRRALGSSGLLMTWLVVRQWLLPVVAGVACGCAAAAIASRQALSLAIPVPVDDLWPWLLPAMLISAAAIASTVPVAGLLKRSPLSDVLRGE